MPFAATTWKLLKPEAIQPVLESFCTIVEPSPRLVGWVVQRHLIKLLMNEDCIWLHAHSAAGSGVDTGSHLSPEDSEAVQATMKAIAAAGDSSDDITTAQGR